MGWTGLPEPTGLYDPRFEHDACGTGFVADLRGRRSHAILQKALTCVSCLTHRGAVDADAKTGDGAGVTLQIPYRLLEKDLARGGKTVIPDADLAVGMLFLPRDARRREQCKNTVGDVLATSGLATLGWREVPVHPDGLGAKARDTAPVIEQVLLGCPVGMADEGYERALYVVRREIERRVRLLGVDDFYIPSFSHRTVVYKGLFVGAQLNQFFGDLEDTSFETGLAVFHQRYSTNTFPTWALAQPFRMIAHNGEINTLQSNRVWTQAREAEFRSSVWKDQIGKIKNVIQPGGSDSACFDNVLELVTLSGRGVLHAMSLLIPEAYQNMHHMDPVVRAYYEYQSAFCEPWDGPAAMAFTDGVIAGACLDRNGLRPARYKVTRDGLVVMGSEVGLIDIPDEEVVEKGRLGPGKMLAVDTGRGVLLRDEEIKLQLARQKPYADWVAEHMVRPEIVDIHPEMGAATLPPAELLRLQKAFGYWGDEVRLMLRPMAEQGKEAVWSMGDDTPLAVLSDKPQILYRYFKQLFAQVTNPPIDPLREEMVMSLYTGVGRRLSLLEETPEHARLIKFSSAVLSDSEIRWLAANPDPNFAAAVISTLFPVSGGEAGMAEAIERVLAEAEKAVDNGRTILILSDRGVDAAHAAVPMLLAVGGVHHHLLRKNKRLQASLLVESGEPREEHHFACLIGYGASAVNPYVAFETIARLVESGEIRKFDVHKALDNYIVAINHGILKIMSKMGISTLSCYRGAQLFEAIGLAKTVIDRFFAGTVSRVGGIGLELLARDVLAFHRAAFADAAAPEPPPLEEGGFIRFRKGGEYHAFNPNVVKAIHKLAETGSYEDFKTYRDLVENRPLTALKDLLDFRPATPIPIGEVEPVESIVRRFNTSGMSHGALSKETHEALAIAMNRLGAKSNSGEGGESTERIKPRPNGDSANSKVKQVASARFGVTPEYLMSAEQLEIKMAQGSKPGEGGQLPGHKVTAEIAALRHSVPGVTLISPPPHHDIYSIEDLAQLIYDLKTINPKAKISVKLVSEAGIGTIAAGVAKAYADVIHISGHDGGTGASPLSSIKNAGTPMELGLAEAHQVLVLNDLRGRVILRCDGGMKTGRDVVLAAMLGADEYAFGTASVVAAGCVMARQCHLNTCPVGVATQDPRLREKFWGTPEMIVNFFRGVAQEVRERLAGLGVRRLEDLIGRTDLLVQRKADSPKAATLDLGALLAVPDPGGKRDRRNTQDRNDRVDFPLGLKMLAETMDAVEGKRSCTFTSPITNRDRSVGARVSGEIALRYGDAGLPPEVQLDCRFEGSAGQSFGAFLINGMRLTLVGEANDYVGKGQAGGEIVVRPRESAPFEWHRNVIAGNTVRYGATGGSLFVAGRAGERFCVRNSGGLAVVEGVGDHGCEYMTGGLVTVLGEVGKNFAAGMTGGVAYVLDETGSFPTNYNPQLVYLARVTDAEDEGTLHALVTRQWELTRSPRARQLLLQWGRFLPLFWKVVPLPPSAKAATPVLVAITRKRRTLTGLPDEPGRPADGIPGGLGFGERKGM